MRCFVRLWPFVCFILGFWGGGGLFCFCFAGGFCCWLLFCFVFTLALWSLSHLFCLFCFVLGFLFFSLSLSLFFFFFFFPFWWGGGGVQVGADYLRAASAVTTTESSKTTTEAWKEFDASRKHCAEAQLRRLEAVTSHSVS